MQNPLNCGMSGCHNYPIRITPLLWWLSLYAPTGSRISCFYFCARKWNNLIMMTYGVWKKREEAGSRDKTIVTMFVEFAGRI